MRMLSAMPLSSTEIRVTWQVSDELCTKLVHKVGKFRGVLKFVTKNGGHEF